jgi:hypothetical protein
MHGGCSVGGYKNMYLNQQGTKRRYINKMLCKETSINEAPRRKKNEMKV